MALLDDSAAAGAAATMSRLVYGADTKSVVGVKGSSITTSMLEEATFTAAAIATLWLGFGAEMASTAGVEGAMATMTQDLLAPDRTSSASSVPPGTNARVAGVIPTPQSALGLQHSRAGSSHPTIAADRAAETELFGSVSTPATGYPEAPRPMPFHEKLEGVKDYQERLGEARLAAGLPVKNGREFAANMGRTAHQVIDVSCTSVGNCEVFAAGEWEQPSYVQGSADRGGRELEP